MIPFRKSIAFRLFILSFILLALPLLVDSFILVYTRYQNALKDAKNYLIESANLRELPLSSIHPSKKALLDLFVHELNLQDHFPSKPNAEIDQRLEEFAKIGGLYGVFLLKLTPEGRFIVTGSGLPQFLGRDFTDFFRLRNLYSARSLKKGYTTYISYDSYTLQPFFVVVHLVYSLKENKIVGAIAVSDNITSKLSDLLAKSTGVYPVHFALLLPSSVVFAASDPDLRFQYFSSLDPKYKKLFILEEPEAGKMLPEEPLILTHQNSDPFFEFQWKGETQIAYIKYLDGANYGLLTYASKKDIYRSPFVHVLDIYSVYFSILIFGGSIALVIIYRMAMPIRSLSDVMLKIQAGDLSTRYKKDWLGYEINDLGIVFNEMIESVLQLQKVAEEDRVKKETLAQELKIGREAQFRLLPQKMPQYPGVEIAEICIPAIEVGGDFYDVFVKGEGEQSQLVLAIADASGKGVQACFYSLSVRNMFRTYARAFPDIADSLTHTNALFCQDTGDSGMFVTLLGGVYDAKTKHFHYYSCGHNPGFIRRKNGEIEILKGMGIALGVLPFEGAKSEQVSLHEGDTLVFYTDGVTEAMNRQGDLFGEERLAVCLKEVGDKSAAEIIDSLIEQVRKFVGTASQHDDITMVVLKVK